jgi:hypothetical protein
MSQTQFSGNEQFAEDVDRLYNGERLVESGDEAYQADLELADLMNRASFTPSQSYKTQLHVQLIDRLYQQHQPKEVRFMFPKVLRSVLVAVVAALFLFAVVFAASPDARAAAKQIAERFVGVNSASDLLPGRDTVPNGPPSGVSIAGNDSSGRPQSPTGSLPLNPANTQSKADMITVEEAQAYLEFTVKVPSYLPEGYSFLGVSPQPEVPNIDPTGGKLPVPDDLPKLGPMQQAMLVFGNGGSDVILLSENKKPTDIAAIDGQFPVGQGAAQDVTINGQPGQFINGTWTPDGWKEGGFYQLHWVGSDGITYDLASSVLDLEELMAIAESIQ